MGQRTSDPSSGPGLLIGSKLRPAKPPVDLVERPHLIDSLHRSLDGRITLVAAPAGYGKTTLVSQFLDVHPSIPAAWLGLDRLDNDLERFVRYVAAALARVDERRLAETEEVLTALRLPPPMVLAESLVHDCKRLSRRTVLVLDDYGFIRTEAVHEYVGALVSKLPSTLHVVIVSRIDPPLPLSLWRSRHWLHELRAEHLRCTRDETKALVEVSTEIALADETIDALHRKTEGWITGLRLALLSLAGSTDPEEQASAFSASERLVADYLMEEVLARQPPEILEFLAITSVLERFNPELCDELLTGLGCESAGQSRELLQRILQKNLFMTPLDLAGGWYRYHQLFREFLVERFGRLTPALEREEILRRAGMWYCENGWTEEGLDCFVAAGDLDAAEDAIGSQLSEVLAADLSRRTLVRWLGLFPPGEERQRIPLLVALSYIRTLRSDFERVERLLEMMDAVRESSPTDRQRRWLREFRFDLEFLRTITSFWKGELDRTREHASRVLDEGSGCSAFCRMMTVPYYGASLALTGRRAEYLLFVDHSAASMGAADGSQRLPFIVVEATVHLYRGELAECRAVAVRLTTSSDFAIPKYFETVGHSLLGAVAYEHDQLDEAERHFLAAESRRFEAPAFVDLSAVSGLALVELARGNLAAAEQHAQTARSIIVETGSSFLQRGSEAVERLLAVAAGTQPDGTAPPPDGTDFADWSIIQPSQSWAWARLRCPSIEAREAALGVVDAALDRAEAHGVTRRAIQLSALRALALDSLDRRDEAIPVLETALRRGAELGLFRSFVDLGEGIRPLLHAVSERSADDEYVATLLEALRGPGRRTSRSTEKLRDSASASQGSGGTRPTGATVPGNRTPLDILTNRELDVLELLGRRLTNKEIAARLGISPATIKMHTLGIYRKLGVHGRRQAVAAAIEQGILRG